ncbi:hypothetical protein N9J72_02080 [Candidatus Gracilibacteria bacterium]|nr:hypothetical protein [Candidatus Gracilibacteria bacterium]
MAGPENFHIPDEIQKVDTQTQESNEGIESQDFQLPEEIQERLKKIDTALFEEHIQTLPEKEQQDIYTLILGTNKRKFNRYIKKNGFIINGDTRRAFESKFGVKKIEQRVIEKGQKVENTNTEEQLLEQDREAVKRHIEIFSGKNDIFADIPDFQDILQRLDGIIEEGEVKEIQQINTDIIAFFKRDAGLESVAQAMYESSPEDYNNFKEYATSLDESFTQRFVDYEKYRDKNSPNIDNDLIQRQIQAGLGPGKVQKFGQFVQTQNEGNTVTMNMSNQPPTRKIGVSGSGLQLETDVPIGDFFDVIEQEGLVYEKVAKENEPKIVFLERMQGSDVKEYIESSDFQDATLKNAKIIISGLIGLGPNMSLEQVCGTSFSSKEDLRSFCLNGAMAQKERLEEEIDEKHKAYQDALESKVQAQQELQSEMDLVSFDALQQITSLGLDVVWEDIQILFLDTAIKQQIMDAIPGFDVNNIDVAAGDFGQSGLEKDNVLKFRENMTKFANIVYFGEISPSEKMAFNVNTYKAMELGDVDNTKLNIGAIRDSQRLVIGGSTNITLIKERIAAAAGA